MPAHHVCDAVIHRHEEPAPPILLRVEPRRVRTPQLVRHIRRVIRPLWLRSPRGCFPRRTGASSPFSRISRSTRFLPTPIPLALRRARDLPVAFAQEVALLQHLSDLLHQLLVAQLRLRSALLQPCRPVALFSISGRVDRRAPHPPDLADHRQRVEPPCPRTHPRPRFKSFSSSSPYPLFSRSSLASSSRIVNSPSFARVRVSSRSPGSRPRRLSPC